MRRAERQDAVVVADSGTLCPYFSAYYELAKAGRYPWSNRAHGALGYSMAAAVGAAYGRLGAKIVSVMGNGSFVFTAAFGVKSWKVEDPTELRPILKRAVEAGEPTLVDVVCQPLHEAEAPVSEWVA